MKNLLFIAIALASFTLGAQNVSGKAYYESKTTVDMDGFGGREMSEEMKKGIMARMKSMLEKTLILSFEGDESTYKEEEKLEAGAGGMGGMRMMMGSFTPGIQYKNVSSNELLEEREFFGKEFLIRDTIANLDWQITKEQKMIGEYVAIKATAIKKIDENDFSFARRKGPRGDRGVRSAQEKKEYSVVKAKADKELAEDPMSQIEVPKELTVTAWFTPMIPVKNGPAEYGGLPGLILELNIDRQTILCSKIVVNPADGMEIKKPSKGKEVSREDFNKIVKEKTEEMRENFRGSGGRRGGGRFGG
ncbi:MAG: GLPGLI family protein [Saprospiraceae bacterium]|jgi:GLPGLI family protein|uniref:GLPGLI family protein n=1 Tax=Patiriisocius sp. Uisw_047 TaxID=3230969 RepID=UPI0039ECD7C7